MKKLLYILLLFLFLAACSNESPHKRGKDGPRKDCSNDSIVKLYPFETDLDMDYYKTIILKSYKKGTAFSMFEGDIKPIIVSKQFDKRNEFFYLSRWVFSFKKGLNINHDYIVCFIGGEDTVKFKLSDITMGDVPHFAGDHATYHCVIVNYKLNGKDNPNSANICLNHTGYYKAKTGIIE